MYTERIEQTSANAICEFQGGVLAHPAYLPIRSIDRRPSAFRANRKIRYAGRKSETKKMMAKMCPAASAGPGRPSPIVRSRRGRAVTRNRDVIGRDCHGGRAAETRRRGRHEMDEKGGRPPPSCARGTREFRGIYGCDRASDCPAGFRYLRDRRGGCRAMSRRAAGPPEPCWCSHGRRRRRPYDASPGTNIPAAPSSTPFSTAMQRIVRCTSAPSSPLQRSPRPSCLTPSPPAARPTYPADWSPPFPPLRATRLA